MRPELHAACAAFPPLPAPDMHELADDIKQNGLIEPITLTADGLLLDGRNRWDACEIADVEPRTVIYDGDDPVSFVLSKNKHRRHLDKSQMAMIVGRLANLPAHRPGGSILKKNTSSAEALSKQGNVPLAYINYARTLIKKGEPHIVAMADEGKVNVRVAAEAVRTSDRLTQASWTQDDVEREGRKVVNSYPSNQRGAATRRDAPDGRKRKSAKAAAPKVIDPPYMFNKWPTPEETGYPVNGTVNEQDEHRARYGRTQLHPMDVTHMLEHEGETASLEVALVSLTGSTKPSAERFFELIDKMLAWTPQPGATNGRERDFAPKARRRLEVIRERVPKAIALLKALERKLIERDAGRSGAAGAHIHEAPPQVS